MMDGSVNPLEAALEALDMALVLADPGDPSSLGPVAAALRAAAGVVSAGGDGDAGMASALEAAARDLDPASASGAAAALEAATAVRERLAARGRAGVPPESVVDAKLLGDFLSRQDEILEELEALALDTGREGAREAAARIFHTLKGEAGLLGLAEVERYCHRMEDALASGPGAELETRLLEAKDWLGERFRSLAGGGAVAETRLEESAPPVAAGDDPFRIPASADPMLLADFKAEATEHLAHSDRFLMSLESDPGNQECLHAVFRAFHTLKGVASFLELKGIQELAHQAENVLDLARGGKLRLAGPAMDLAFEAVDSLRKFTAALEPGATHYADAGELRHWETLLARLRTVANGGEVVAMADSNPEPKAPAPEAAQAPKAAVRETFKVDAERMDRLLEAIGELVISQSMVSAAPELREGLSPRLAQQLGRLGKITRELQEMGTSMRMVPLRATFQKMARLARDLSKKSGKDVELRMAGEDTELDKSVAERIGDPLIHMVRNAIDHGIEAGAGERTAAGKPVRATVRLGAYQKGGNVFIEVGDDGRGLDREAILAKARAKGLWTAEEPPPEAEIWDFIFAPGFSTAKAITDISGRGVGMDVVKRNVEALRGQIAIQSERGKGTTFIIRLPLTTAIIDGMVVRVAGERYLLPTQSIVRIVPVVGTDRNRIADRGEVLRVQGRIIPLFRLADLLRCPASGTEALAVVVECGGTQAAFAIDELLGQQQVVIKGLTGVVGGVDGLSGGAIMPDGQVGILLDVEGLLRLARQGDEGARAQEPSPPVTESANRT